MRDLVQVQIGDWLVHFCEPFHINKHLICLCTTVAVWQLEKQVYLSDAKF